MPGKIIIIEDNPADAKILRLALADRDASLDTVVLSDGEKALQFFSELPDSRTAAVCDLILLDLNLPRVSGFEVLEFLKCHPELKKIPTLVLSGSSSQQDIERCYACGANSYLSKPVGIDEVFSMAAELVSYWFDFAKRPRSQRVYGAV